MAGKIPESNPIKADNPVPRAILDILNTNSNSSALVKRIEIIQTKSNPITPPITESITDSNKN